MGYSFSGTAIIGKLFRVGIGISAPAAVGFYYSGDV